MNNNEIIIGFAANFIQMMCTAIGFALRLPRPVLFRIALLSATATNGYAAFAYAAPHALPNALAVDLGGDSVLYLSILVSFLIGGAETVRATTSQRTASLVALGLGVLLAFSLPSVAIYFRNQTVLTATSVQQAKVQLDSVSQDVGDIKLGLQDSSIRRSGQLLENRNLMYLVLDRQDDIMDAIDAINRKLGVPVRPRKRLMFAVKHIEHPRPHPQYSTPPVLPPVLPVIKPLKKK